MPDHMRRLWVFDWDGTLVDSLGRIETCMAQAIADTGLPERDPAAIRNIIGLGLAEAIGVLFPESLPAERERLRGHYAQRFVAADQQPCPFHDGALELLSALRTQGDLITVATGKSRRGLDRALAAHGLHDWFDASRCADETASKPAPDMVLELLQLTAVQPAAAVMVGDTEYDLAMAVAAGVHGIGVDFGAHAVERLQRHAPLACVSHLTQLLEWRQHIRGA